MSKRFVKTGSKQQIIYICCLFFFIEIVFSFLFRKFFFTKIQQLILAMQVNNIVINFFFQLAQKYL